MIKTKKKTKPAPKELPPGWKWDTLAKEKLNLGYRAIYPIEDGRCLQTLCCATEQDAIASAHQVDLARTEGLVGLAGHGLVSRGPETNGDEPALEKALDLALHSVQGAAERWRPVIASGATDAELMAAIGNEFGLGGGSTTNGGYSYKGGKSPEFTWPDPLNGWKAQVLKGKRLLAKVREVMEIGAPCTTACLLCGETAEKGHLCEPGKSPTPLVAPSLLCVCGHRADAHAPFNHPEEPPRECVECKCDRFVAADSAPLAVELLRRKAAKVKSPAIEVISQGEIDVVEEELVADPVGKRLHQEALKGWRREPGSADSAPAANGHRPQILQLIPLDQIVPSPTNPRKYFDPDRLKELADSIKDHGLAQPILVRPRTLWQQVVGFVARQRAVFDARGTGYGISRGQFEDAGIHFESGEYDKAIDLLRKEQRIERAIGINSDQPSPGAYKPIGDRDQLGPDVFCYELIAGERRLRAARLAGLAEIEAKVRDLDDKAALEIQMIENLQRDDLSPIEEADGYSAMLAVKNEDGTPAYTVDTLAARIGKKGKSKSYVYARLKLRNLPPKAIEAVLKGDIPATVGEMIGRLPNMEMRERFWNDWFEDYGKEYFEIPSFREVKNQIESEYTRELKSAPFSRTDAKLLPEAGACKTCPKMTGNNRDEYPDSRADICTDTACYDRKLKAHFERQVERAKGNGGRVLSEQESAKLFNVAGGSAWLRHEAQQDYVPLEDKPWQDKEHRSYKQLLDGHVEPVVAIDSLGKPHYLAPKEEAAKVLKEQHGIRLGSSGGDNDYKREERKRQEQKKIRQQTAAEIVTQAIRPWPFPVLADPAFLRVMARFLIESGDADVARAIAKRRGIDCDKNDVRGSIAAIVDGMEAEDIPDLIVECLLQRELEFWAQYGSEREKFALCDYFDLNPKVVQKKVAAEAKKAAKKKPKPKAKATAQV